MYPLPTELGNMNHTVNAANIDQTPRRRSWILRCLIFFADLDFVQMFPISRGVHHGNGADRTDNTLLDWLTSDT